MAITAITRLAEELAEAHLCNDPFTASFLGWGGYDDRVPDLSPHARQEWRDLLVDVVVRCDRLDEDAVDIDGRVLLAAVRDDATRALALADSRVEEFSVTPLPLPGPSMMLLAAARAVVTDAASASAYLTRCRAFRAYINQYAQRLQSAVEDGLLPVAPLVEDAIRGLRDYLAQTGSDPLLGHRPPATWDGAAAWRDELERVVRDDVRPAIAQHVDLLVELLPRSRPPERAGLLYLPGGVAAYACCIRNGTTLALDADDIHRLGLAALAEVEERIAELGGQLLHAGSAGEVMARLRDDPSLTATAGDDPMARARAAIARAEQRLADMFHPPLPPPCAVEAMPATVAASGSPPMYSPPARDGSRPGAYLFNTAYPGPATSWAAEATAFHEGVPGHHAQLARLQLVDLPLLLTALPVSAHLEGWGLYAEQLAERVRPVHRRHPTAGHVGHAGLAGDPPRAGHRPARPWLDPNPGVAVRTGAYPDARILRHCRDRPLHRHARPGLGLPHRPARSPPSTRRRPRPARSRLRHPRLSRRRPRPWQPAAGRVIPSRRGVGDLRRRRIASQDHLTYRRSPLVGRAPAITDTGTRICRR
jgi:uncharacterized protein (DUF885 family)